jgi:2-polyprenyl-3-methyl-5-hydroxy-6-metoxy-1,4-benzoquinol methylase
LDLSEVSTRGDNDSASRHPWETARFHFFHKVLLKHAGIVAGARILDIGSGDAWFAHQLAQHWPCPLDIDCWDSAYDASTSRIDSAPDLVTEKKQRITYVPNKPQGTYALTLMLDVLEHVADDEAFLRSVADEHLAPGGKLLFSVPAWPALYSAHDVRLGHCRRYTPAKAARLLQRCGLRVDAQGGLFHCLLLPRLVSVIAQKVVQSMAQSDPKTLGDWRHGAAATRLVDAVLRTEGVFSGGFSKLGLDVPGLTWWALCTKP